MAALRLSVTSLGFCTRETALATWTQPLPGCVTLGNLPTLSVLDSHCFFVPLLWMEKDSPPPLREWEKLDRRVWAHCVWPAGDTSRRQAWARVVPMAASGPHRDSSDGSLARILGGAPGFTAPPRLTPCIWRVSMGPMIFQLLFSA